LFHCDGDSTDSREPDLVALHLGDEAAINKVVMPLMAAFAAVFSGQLDPAPLNLIDCADMAPSAPMTSMCSLISAIDDSSVLLKKLFAAAASQRAIRRLILLRLFPTFFTAFFTAAFERPIFFASY